MLHISQLRKLLNSENPFSLKFWKKNGDIVIADNVVCTSSYFHNDTVNIKFLTSEQFRKIHVSCIFEFNGKEVCL